MKRSFLLTVMVALMTTAAFPQFIKQGTILGGGAFEFRSHKDNNSDIRVTNVALMPWAGYLVIDNFVAGALLGINTFSQKNTVSDVKSSDTQLMFGPVARYYMDNGLFAHGQFGFGSNNSKTESGGTTLEFKTSISELRLGVGYAARISDTVLFEPIVGYLSESQKDKSSNVKSTESGFFLMAGFTIFFHSTN